MSCKPVVTLCIRIPVMITHAISSVSRYLALPRRAFGLLPSRHQHFLPLLILALFSQYLYGQDKIFGTVEVYRIGRSSGSFPLVVDGQTKLKISNSHRMTLQMTKGEHQLESSLATVNPVLALSVEAGQTTYVVMDFEHGAYAKAILGGDKSKLFTLTLEHTNRPPPGEFKDEKVDEKLANLIASLPAYHEAILPTATAEVQELSDQEIGEALLQGRHTMDPRTVGLLLEDLQQQIGSALVQGQGVSGYSVRVYTAKQWLQLQASLATREMRPFSIHDVTPELRHKLLHVTASPSTPDSLTGRNMANASNVQRIVLEEGQNRAVMQPLGSEPTTVNLDSSLRSASYQGMTASFPQPDITRPFQIVVIGDGYRKEFAVKDKHLAWLK